MSRLRRGQPRDEPRDERGTALVEFVWLGILLLIPLIWILLSVFEVQRGAYGTSSAARAAGRAFVLAPDDATGRQRAEEAARLALRDQGVEAPLQVRIDCEPIPTDCHAGTSIVRVRIDTRVDLPLLPRILGGGAPSVALDASHRVPVGQFQERDR